MEPTIFEPDFDFTAYIEKRLRDIEDLTERRAAKAVLTDCLLRGIEQSEENYRRLERRVYDEVENDEGKYGVCMAVLKKADLDPISPFFFPLCPEDEEELSIDLAALPESVGAGISFPLFSVFLEAARPLCLELRRAHREFSGALITDKAEYKAYFRLCADLRYKKAVEHLYDTFCANSVSWTTMNCVWLDKFFMVELTRLEELPGEKERFGSIHIELEELARFVCYDVLPVWNIETILYNSADFVMPCISGVNYEHEFPTAKYGEQNGFLIEQNRDIAQVRRERGKLSIITPQETFDQWTAKKVVAGAVTPPIGSLYPLLSNRKADSFTRRMAERTGVRLQTRAEITRRINEFGLERYARLKAVELVSGRGPENGILGEMNDFIRDELLDREGQKTLVLTFETDLLRFYTEDIVNFLVSELQRYFEEYRCLGALTETEARV